MVDGIWSWDGKGGRENRINQDRIYWRAMFSVWSCGEIARGEVLVVTSSSVSLQPVPAAMFCSSCWTVLAPMMTDGMKSFCRHQRSDTWPCVLPLERNQHCKRTKIGGRRQVGKWGHVATTSVTCVQMYSTHLSASNRTPINNNLPEYPKPSDCLFL